MKTTKEFVRSLVTVWGQHEEWEEDAIFYEDENGGMHFTAKGAKEWPNNLEKRINQFLSNE